MEALGKDSEGGEYLPREGLGQERGVERPASRKLGKRKLGVLGMGWQSLMGKAGNLCLCSMPCTCASISDLRAAAEKACAWRCLLTLD